MTPISMELLSDIDGNMLFVMKPQSQTEFAADVRAALDQMKAQPLWAQLKAVQNDQVYEVDAYWFGAGYLAANLVLDDLAKYIAYRPPCKIYCPAGVRYRSKKLSTSPCRGVIKMPEAGTVIS